MMGYGWGMGAGGWVAMTVFWVALVVLVVWLLVRAFPGGPGRTAGPHVGGPTRETPEQILDRRYAAGEIDLETYRTMRTELSSARSTDRPTLAPPADGGAP
ncbi:SHOCT domain-containing protein [Cellulomonas soli]|uniref:SHOCT domain-containing protein n=1 Tax=Cellulomonas soli TaxID=931535 RepID=A0A512PGJ0_9CELL|nr:SHOCT domain-containing protein [Cellulomonas soli]NYI58183.1 putative membrane protein [Cellulomonas soli]GEP70316.1 hypothetical protein CSO01_30310 [Cellulomonas soli]